MIAHGAKHPGLQIPKGHVIGKAASVDLSVVVTVPIAAVDEHVGSPVASHIRERNGLVVKQQVRDRPGHRLSKRDRGGSANDAVGRARNRAALLPFVDVHKPADESRSSTYCSLARPVRT
jgi:hypothetical protein